jgi:glutathione peroxidase
MIKIAIGLGVLVTLAFLVKKKDMSFRQSLLQKVYPLIMWSSKSAGKKQTLINKDSVQPVVSFYALHTKDINGADFNLASLKGKKVLIANTASDCGFTGQYEALEKLSKMYAHKLVVLGFPANDFKEQEIKDNKEIASFCQKNYGVSFPLMAKSIVLKKAAQNAVYKWLTNQTLNGWNQQAPAWNFCKYLVNEEGVLTHYFPMTVDPLAPELIKALE